MTLSTQLELDIVGGFPCVYIVTVKDAVPSVFVNVDDAESFLFSTPNAMGLIVRRLITHLDPLDLTGNVAREIPSVYDATMAYLYSYNGEPRRA